jgi:Ca2+-binding EF-hand superfamily protein
MNILGVSKRDTDIIFEYFDMDASGTLDSYEFTCAIAMLVHSSTELRAELLFKMYDSDNNNYLSRDELVYLIRNYYLAARKKLIAAEVDRKTDEFLKLADLDMDKKLSLREFQVIIFNLELFI